LYPVYKVHSYRKTRKYHIQRTFCVQTSERLLSKSRDEPELEETLQTGILRLVAMCLWRERVSANSNKITKQTQYNTEMPHYGKYYSNTYSNNTNNISAKKQYFNKISYNTNRHVYYLSKKEVESF